MLTAVSGAMLAVWATLAAAYSRWAKSGALPSAAGVALEGGRGEYVPVATQDLEGI